MELTGKIIAVLQERGGISKAGNEWKIQEYVLETMEQYPRKMMFNVFGADRISQFNIQVGEVLTVSFDIDSREYNGRWYTDVRAWRIEPAGQVQPAPMQEYGQPAGAAQAAPMPTIDDLPGDDGSDDLPF